MHERPTRYRDDPTSIFLIALVGMLTCQVLAPWAWLMASRRLEQVQADGETPDTFVVAARVMGIIGTVVMVLAVLYVVGVTVAGITLQLSGLLW